MTTATPQYILDFIRAISPEYPDLYMASFDEQHAVTDATGIIIGLRKDLAAEKEAREAAEKELLGVKEYRQKNPLGGPAKVFDAIADRIRAGEDYYAVLDDYGFTTKEAAERERDELKAKLKAARELLAVEQELAIRGNPFKCENVECARFGQKLWAGDCKCYDEQARKHRDKVRATLEEK